MTKRRSFVERKEDVFLSRISANFAEKSFGQAQDAGPDVIGELGEDSRQEGDQVAGLDVNLDRNKDELIEFPITIRIFEI